MLAGSPVVGTGPQQSQGSPQNHPLKLGDGAVTDAATQFSFKENQT